MAQIAGEIVVGPVAGVAGLPTVRWRIVLWFSAITVLVGVVAASSLAHISSVATTGYHVQKLQSERDAWRMRNAQLRLELARARSLTWVEHDAVSRLNMHRPTELIYLRMEALDAQSAAVNAGQPGRR